MHTASRQCQDAERDAPSCDERVYNVCELPWCDPSYINDCSKLISSPLGAKCEYSSRDLCRTGRDNEFTLQRARSREFKTTQKRVSVGRTQGARADGYGRSSSEASGRTRRCVSHSKRDQYSIPNLFVSTVYRNNQKADKNKKGSKGKAKEGESISAGRASAKTKGKEKEKASGPTITIPKRAAASISEPSVQTKTQESELEPESETEDVQRRDVEDEDEDMLDAETYEDEIEDDGAVEEDEVEDEDEDEEGDIVDQMAIEEDELRKDAKGVEERGHGLDDD